MESFSPKQRRLLIACCVAYTAAYICRTNLTPALAAIQADFGVSAARVGMLPTLFCIPYAAGQIATGYLADRFRARNLVWIGLMGSALMNALFAFAPGLGVLMALWCLNGAFQSMIWTPIVRIFAVNYEDKVRARALFLISFTMIAGYLIAWMLSGALTKGAGWRAAFGASGAVTAIMGIFACRALHDSDSAAQKTEKSAEQPAAMSVGGLLFKTDLIFALLLCLFNGYVRDSIMNWAPKMLSDTQNIDLNGALGVILVIPIVNYLGILFGKRMYRVQQANVFKTMLTMVSLEIVFSLILFACFGAGTLVCAALLALCSAMAYGLNPLITSLTPMEYLYTGRVALVAGLLDATIYLGSAFSGTFVGFLRDHLGWGAVFASWAVFSTFSALAILPKVVRKKAQ